jgi:hypothetical protein
MAVIEGFIKRVATGGPFIYYVTKDGVGFQAADAQADLQTAFNNLRSAIVNAIAGGTVQTLDITVTTSQP